MVLKAAYFRRIGFADDQPVTLADLKAAVGQNPASQASQLNTPTTNNYHDLGCWAALLVAYRATTPTPLPISERTRLERNIATVRSVWSVTLRYRRNRASVVECDRVRGSCEWLIGSRNQL